MTDKAWKATERKYCRMLGCERRGADYADFGGGKNDCADNCGYSAEIRHRKSFTFNEVRDQVRKAEERARFEQVPIAISHTPGDRLDDAIVSMSWKMFRQWFVNQPAEDAE